MDSFNFQTHTRVVFGEGAFDQLGALARELRFSRTLLVADRGLLDCGYVEEASQLLKRSEIAVFDFHDFEANPNSLMIEAGRDFAAPLRIDSIVGLGGGSSLDCAKGINFLVTNGGVIQDYRGFGKAQKPMLPMIGIPTTAGTGSEAQSYALISDAQTHVKMACGDQKAAFQIALLDPRLTLSQPASVAAVAGFDAISHAVESYVTTKRNAVSALFSREAWALLEANYERIIINPRDINARGAMQLGAYYAGLAIENSMLGAAHACANPLTAHYDTAHGIAIARMLPAVVRWNGQAVNSLYSELLKMSDDGFDGSDPSAAMASRLEQLIAAGGLSGNLGQLGISEADLSTLAEEAAGQWTGRFNPRPFSAIDALEVYRCAF
ncbi:MAG: iron-containing alcohol dehydrogenase [Blastocatellia bacterium]